MVDRRLEQAKKQHDVHTRVVLNRAAQRHLDRDTAKKQAAKKNQPTRSTMPSALAHEQQKKQDAKGFAGVFGAVLNNPVARGVLKPLELLSIPQKLAVAGAEGVRANLPDALQGGISGIMNKEKAQADTRSLGDKLRDPRFGVGQLANQIDTGHAGLDKWSNRVVGFAGDTAIDPLTYATFGVGKFHGASGRLALGEDISERVARGTPGLTEEAIARATRLGPAGLSAAEREAAEVAPAGLRFAGARVPGTQTAGGLIEKGVANTRAVIGDHVPRGLGRALSTTPELDAAMGTLRRGSGELTPSEAIGVVARERAEKAAGGVFHAPLAREARQAAAGIKGDKARAAVTHELEDAATNTLNHPIAQWFEKVRQGVVDAGGHMPKRQNYVEHVFTPEGEKVMKHATREVVSSKSAAAASQKARVIQPGGRYTIGGKLYTPVKATIQEGNEWSLKNLGFKLYEDDIVKIMDRHLAEASRSVGRVKGLERLGEVGATHTIDTAGRRVVDPQAIASLEAEMAGAKGDFGAAVKGLREHGALARDDASEIAFHAGHDDLAHSVLLPSGQKGKGVSKAVAEAQATRDDLVQVVQGLGPDTPEGRAVQGLLSSYDAGVQSLEAHGAALKDQAKFIRDAKAGKLDEMMMDELASGFTRLGKGLLADDGSVIVRQVLADQFKNVHESVRSGGLWQVLDKYNTFFKAYATATPGFHIRNGMTAAFMNFADGVSLRSQLEAISAWRNYLRADMNPDKWLAELPEHERSLYQQALEAVYSSGGGHGQYSADELALNKVGKITNNSVTRASQKAGERVEGQARFAMALDTIREGGSVAEASARIERIHFDYSKLSQFDRQMKRIIPFWTYMSRNLPLQVQQMWTNPRAYLIYQNLQRNMGQITPDMNVPQAWEDQGAFGVTDGILAMPDLPQTRLFRETEKFGDPAQFLQGLTPPLRVALETMLMNKKLYGDMPFKENGFTALDHELAILRPVLQPLGLTDTAGDGSTVANEKLVYAIQQLVPLLGQAERLDPVSNDPYYSERKLQSLLSYLGIPIKQLTPEVQKREAARRQRTAGFAEANAAARAKALANFSATG